MLQSAKKFHKTNSFLTLIFELATFFAEPFIGDFHEKDICDHICFFNISRGILPCGGNIVSLSRRNADGSRFSSSAANALRRRFL